MNFSLILQNEIALERQIISILNANFRPYYSGKNFYNFKCNICGDSKYNKFKKRAYLLKKDGKSWHYYCHNGGCGASMSAIKWMKEYFPLYYKDYIREILNNKKENPSIKKNIVREINKNNITEKEDIQYFIPILKGKDELFDKAIQICRDRLIPEEVWKKWFVAINGKYKNRLIIPFFDDKGKIYYWQGRKLKDWMIPKYLSRLGNQFNSIYNYFMVDKSKPVIILEGVIDSLFVENSIALTGLKCCNEKLNIFKNRYWLFDSDKGGKAESIKMLSKGEYVFCWSKFIKDNNLPLRDKWDINEVCIYLKRTNKFTFEELKLYFTNSIFDKVCFII